MIFNKYRALYFFFKAKSASEKLTFNPSRPDVFGVRRDG